MTLAWIKQETEFSLWIFNSYGIALLDDVSVLGHETEHSVFRAVSQACQPTLNSLVKHRDFVSLIQ